PIELLEVRDRDLAGAEAVEANPVLELAQALGEPCFEVGRGDRDVEHPLEAVGYAFCYLHGDDLYVLAAAARSVLRYRVRYRAATPKRRGAGGGARTPTTFVTGT